MQSVVKSTAPAPVSWWVMLLATLAVGLIAGFAAIALSILLLACEIVDCAAASQA